MRRALAIHPGSHSTAATRIDVEVTRSGPGKLLLHYAVRGAIRDLRLPPAAAPERADELWKDTCFEAFIRRPPSEAYCELNFSPSTQWAAYRFGGYREGMSSIDGFRAPEIVPRTSTDLFEIRVSLDLAHAPDLSPGTPWRLGISAIIEDTSGAKSYWALAHPQGKPDFHHADGFALELAPEQT
jgi:hypothetical protein